MRVERIASVVFSLFFAASVAFAQQQEGSIEGTVTTGAGLPLAGVVLEARGGAAAIRAITLREGSYRFPWLPPGTYTVTATRDGFLPARGSATVVLGGRQLLDLVLELGEASRPAAVAAPRAPAVARAAAGSRFGIVPSSDSQRLPSADADVASLVAFAPGVFPVATNGSRRGGAPQASAGLHTQIDGAEVGESLFYVDGVNWTDAGVGGTRRRLPAQFVEQVRVSASGFDAASIGSAGGVVNVVTKAGSDRFDGSVASHFEAEWLLGAVRPRWRIDAFDNARGELVWPARDQWRHNNPAAEVGGPLRRGRAWFHAGYGYDRSDYRRAAIFLESPLPFERRQFRWFTLSRDVNWNVTARLGEAVRVKLTGARGLARRRGSAPALQPGGARLADGTPADGFTTAGWDGDPVLFDQRWNQVGVDRPSGAYSAQADWVVSPSTAMRVNGSYDVDDARTPAGFYGGETRRVFGSSNAAMPGIPGSLKFPRNYADGRETTGIAEQFVARVAVSAEATRLAEWYGRHVVAAGGRAERITDRENVGEQRPTITLMWDEAYAASDGRLVAGRYGYYRISQQRTFGRSVSHAAALWLQDEWTPARRVTVDAGVRIEDERAGSFTTDPGVRFTFADKIAPRLGATFDLDRARTTLRGTYGWSYDRMTLTAMRRLFGADASNSYVYTLDTYDWPAIECLPAEQGCPGVFIQREAGARPVNAVDAGLSAVFGEPRNGIDPRLRPGRSGELTLAVDRAVARRTTIGVRYVRKWLARTVEGVQVVVPGAGIVALLANPGVGMARTPLPDRPQFPMPVPARNHDAVEISLASRARGWSLDADYRFSALRGNYAGTAGSDESGRSCAGCTRYFRSPYASWDSTGREVWGPLPADRPHHLRLRATCDLPWRFSLGASLVVESGTPLSSRLSWKGATVYYNGRGDLGRTPGLSQLDLLVRHDVPAGGGRLSLSATITNVFDQATPTAYGTSPWRGTFNLGDDVFFGGWDAAVLAERIRTTGGTLRDNPLYLKPSGYQSRRSIRFTAKVVF